MFVGGGEWTGPHDFEEGSALFDLVVDALGDWSCVGGQVVGKHHAAAGGHRQSGDGEPDDLVGVEQIARHAVRGLNAQERRIVLVAQIQAGGIAAQHLLSLDHEIAQDLVQSATRVDHREQVAQPFGAQAAHHIRGSRGHGRQYTAKLPLPLGEAARSAGEGCKRAEAFVLVRTPHPNPLPEGEGVKLAPNAPRSFDRRHAGSTGGDQPARRGHRAGLLAAYGPFALAIRDPGRNERPRLRGGDAGALLAAATTTLSQPVPARSRSSKPV